MSRTSSGGPADTVAVMRRRDAKEAEQLLVRVLEAIERGDLAADGPAATAVAHRLEGALLALQATGRATARAEGGSRTDASRSL